MDKKITVYPPYWCIQVSDNTFVGLNEDIYHSQAIQFPSRRSAWIFRDDAYGKDSTFPIRQFIHDGDNYQMQPLWLWP